MVQDSSLVIPFPVIRLWCLGKHADYQTYSLGTQFTDLVSLDSGPLTIFGQSIGGAIESVGFDGVDGILGYVYDLTCDFGIHRHPTYRIGPVGLTQGTLSPDETSTIPTGEFSFYLLDVHKLQECG